MSYCIRRFGLFFSVAALAQMSFVAASFDLGQYQRLVEGGTQAPADAIALLPSSVDEVVARKNFAIERAKAQLETFLSIPAAERTFANTVGFLDEVSKQLSITSCGINRRGMIESNDELRNACKDAEIELNAFSIDHFGSKKIYHAFKEYEQDAWQTEMLTDEERGIMRGSMRGFAKAGYELDDEAFARLQELKKDLSVISNNFQRNIAEDNREILVTKDALVGVDEDFIGSLEERDGLLVVPCNYVSSSAISGYCESHETRRAFSLEMGKRGAPANSAVLEDLIAKRHDLAEMLGYKSYAEYCIDGEMAENPETVQSFLDGLRPGVAAACAQEMAHLADNLPDGVSLDGEGRFRIGDLSYIYTKYRKKHFGIDHREIAKYFPLEKTIKGLFHIYEQLLGVRLQQEVVENAWHESVRLLSVRRPADNMLLGYVFLDLFPRENKYNHACCASVTFAKGNEVASTLVIANFPKGNAGKPALLRHGQVETFFHEFGHAMHHVLGRTQHYGSSGTHVEHDFVEMPSQIFERWIWDRQLLKQISSHYETGEPLSDAMIDSMLAARHLGSAYNYVYQLMAAQVSLDIYGPEREVDMVALWKAYNEKAFPFMEQKDPNYGFASFGHLNHYSAKYYCYMWSEVFAVDCFERIKQHGLRNPEIGARFVHDILGRGGSMPAKDMLYNFLGREPNKDAFLREIGLAESA